VIRNLLFLAPLLATLSCGSSKPAEAPSSEPSPKEETKAESEPAAEEKATASESVAPGKLPTECETRGDTCVLPKSFVKRLCQNPMPNVALALFSSGTPWTRAYLTRKTKAWNAEGGASVEDWLDFDEEVLLLDARLPPKGGMQVSGMGGYQALRWDGTCVTLASEEVATRKPPSPKYPRLLWRWYDDPIKEALRKSPDVDRAYLAQRKECKGVSVGEVTKKCEVADHALVEAIVAHVSGSGGLPEPEKIP
jgi:hypothetical protein